MLFRSENKDVVAQESTVTENISAGGAVILTDFYAEPGTFLRVISERCGVDIISVVQARRQETDGVSRMHVEFIDRLFPLNGIV